MLAGDFVVANVDSVDEVLQEWEQAFLGASESRSTIVAANDIPAAAIALDVGPGTVREFASILATCHTIVWNGG